MMQHALVPVGLSADVAVLTGPLLLRAAGASDGSLAQHRRHWPEPIATPARDLIELAERARLTGRGGADFRFAAKLRTALGSGRRRELVVNAAEGEPASAKDSALLYTTPHLVLDGAQLVAEALGVAGVHVVVPLERPSVLEAARRAIEERSGATGFGELRFELHTSTGFVGGQSSAILELLAGRENLPVSAWQPSAVSGLRGRPTVISNAETFAQLAALRSIGPEAYARLGTSDEPGTRLLTVAADGPGGIVLEVEHGTPLTAVLDLAGYRPGQPVLIGGYHGGWLSAAEAGSMSVSASALLAAGVRLGAGVVLPLLPGDCPVSYTAQVVNYLAQRRAKRCGPCTFGLPALALACEQLAEPGRSVSGGSVSGPGTVARIRQLCTLVIGRGACQHPDGTAALVTSMLDTFPDEVDRHERGTCTARSPAMT